MSDTEQGPQASAEADLTKTEEGDVRADRSKPRVKPDKEEHRKRRLAGSKGARTTLLKKIEETREQVRTTRMTIGERKAAHAVVLDAVADLRRLDRRIFWLENPDTPEPEDNVEDDDQ